MKKPIFLTLAFLANTCAAAVIIFFLGTGLSIASDFCDGFQEGYETGYKQAKNSNLPPLAPLCPLQPIKRSGDPDSDFEHGYTIGYRKGTVAGSS